MRLGTVLALCLITSCWRGRNRRAANDHPRRAFIDAVHASSATGATLALDDVRRGRGSAYRMVADRQLGLID